MENTQFLEDIKQNVIPIESDNYHLWEFSKMKITKWIYAPFSGIFVYFFIFKVFCDVNLIDRKRPYYKGGKLFMIAFFPQLFFIVAFVILLMVFSIGTISSFNPKTHKYVFLYSLIPLLANFIISPISIFLVKKNFKKVFKINGLDQKNFNKVIVYRNAQIFDNKSYFEKLLKSPNQKIDKFFLSQNFSCIYDKPLTENYEGTKIQARELAATKQDGYMPSGTLFFMLFEFTLIFLIKFLDYFFFCNILVQKAINDNKNKLVKKIQWLIFLNYAFTVLFWAGFLLFFALPDSNFSYFAQNLNPSEQLQQMLIHYCGYCLALFLGFVAITVIRSYFTKKLVIKWCLKEYSWS